MRFPDHLLDEIRDRLPISQVVGEHVVWDNRKSKPQARDFWANCPFHGEKRPSFHADDRKGIYHCFGCGVTGDHFRFLTDKVGLSFPDAVERLAAMAGVTLPDRPRREETPEERRARDERVAADNERHRVERERRDAEFAAKQVERIQTVNEMLGECAPLRGTLGDAYLQHRGLPPVSTWPWDPGTTIMFHPNLYYELDRNVGKLPALVARVDDAFGDAVAAWRIFLHRSKPEKAPVENAKVGLGPAKGGAVRIGGMGPKIGMGEGLETCLAAWALEGFRYPVWAGLSTSGVTSFEPPMEVERINIFPDGDYGKLLPDQDRILAPAGMTAARELQARMVSTGIKTSISEMCLHGDALDLLITKRKYEERSASPP